MRESQRLVLRAGEIRTRLSELAGISELTDEHRGEIDTLRNEYGDVERRQAAALIAEDVPEETRTDETSESPWWPATTYGWYQARVAPSPRTR